MALWSCAPVHIALQRLPALAGRVHIQPMFGLAAELSICQARLGAFVCLNLSEETWENPSQDPPWWQGVFRYQSSPRTSLFSDAAEHRFLPFSYGTGGILLSTGVKKNYIFPQLEGPPPAQQTADMSQSRPAEPHQTNSILIALTAVFWAAFSTFLPHTGCFSMFSCLAEFPPSSPEHFWLPRQLRDSN